MTMGKIFNMLLCILMSNLAISYAQSCNIYAFSSNVSYAKCVSLPVLNFHLYWNYHPNGTVNLAFRHTGSTTSQWVAWAINVRGAGMIGAQAIVAATSSSGGILIFTSAIDAYATSLQGTELSFDLTYTWAEMINGTLGVYVTLVLPKGRTRFNHVWQVGPVITGVSSMHSLGPDNRKSFGTIDFITGETSGGGAIGNFGRSLQRRRNTHGAVSWGVLMPMGAMAARYFKVFEVAYSAWFYIHAATQTSAYIVGVVGWATGLKLGSDSTRIIYNTHRNIGITLFAFGTIQVFALLLRPNSDNKYRFYWNIYHRSLGYSVIILSIINVYKGLDIMDPEMIWKNTYTGIIISLGVITFICEALTWFIVFKRKKEDDQRANA